ncbi:MAG TPA: hypothetical protein VM938_15820 [Acidimicrobiales bacterium]|nr:hypothetical protein [Acidimicrobiales bacterium]
MPWCESCSRYWTPPSMGEGGECPTCGGVIADAAVEDVPAVPWHFKLLLVALVLYLVFRAWQGVEWLTARF